MCKQTRLAIAAATSTLLGLSVIAPSIQAADTAPRSATEVRLMLAQTDSKERRDDRQEDRQGDRGDRQDNRDDCRDEGGLAGKDKRDCKQEGRQDGPDEEKPEGDGGTEG